MKALPFDSIETKGCFSVDLSLLLQGLSDAPVPTAVRMECRLPQNRKKPMLELRNLQATSNTSRMPEL